MNNSGMILFFVILGFVVVYIVVDRICRAFEKKQSYKAAIDALIESSKSETPEGAALYRMFIQYAEKTLTEEFGEKNGSK